MNNPYQYYSLEELASDLYFRKWVLDSDPETRRFWQDFIEKHPEKAPLIHEAKSLIEGVHTYFDTTATGSHQVQQHFEAVIRRAGDDPIPSESLAVISHFSFKKLAVAASILLLIGSIGWVWLGQLNSIHTYSTAYGEWKTVNLPDGSTARLNANSALQFAENWEEGSDRKVWLKGEAFFEVEKKPATGAKFYVITSDVSVEVLGTSFNLHSRGEKTEVFLEEGKIRLEAGRQETYMDPGDFISYSAEKQQITEKRKAVNELPSSWKDGVLILQEKSVRAIFDKIEEIYGVEFQVKDSRLLESHTTVRIPMDKLEIALPILEKTLGTRIKQQGKHLIVY